jgi:hypothetical protein
MYIFKRKKAPADLFDRLEHEASDELGLLGELGPKDFGTEHLIELHALVCTRMILQKRALSLSVAVGAAGAGWMLLGILAWSVKSQILSVVSFIAAIMCILAFAGMLVRTYMLFGAQGQLVHTRLSIEDELRSRREWMRRQPESW